MNVSLADIELAVDFVSAEPYGNNAAYVSLDTGEIYLVSDYTDCELPDDLEESDRYLPIPHKDDLGLGRQLVHDFVAAQAPHLADAAASAFRRRGAYRKWKSILADEQLLDAWYEFQNQREAKAIADWCEENRIPLRPQSED